ncbi:MAG: endonuclease III domain-containing protein [Methanobacteriota archaeon]
MNRAREIFDRLLATYGPQRWWPAETPFEVIVGALLMAQTSWRNVERAIATLKAAGLLNPHRLAAARAATIRRHVRGTGLYGVKPGRLRAFCRHLVASSGGDLRAYFDRPLDAVRADLLHQPGVGPETADSILLYASDHATFVVDAYTVRIARRVGLVGSDDVGRVKAFFERHVPRDLAAYREAHALLVAHAKARCRPTPRCGGCPLFDVCDHGRKTYAGA